jgi:hypothetical protein
VEPGLRIRFTKASGDKEAKENPEHIFVTVLSLNSDPVQKQTQTGSMHTYVHYSLANVPNNSGLPIRRHSSITQLDISGQMHSRFGNIQIIF